MASLSPPVETGVKPDFLYNLPLGTRSQYLRTDFLHYISLLENFGQGYGSEKSDSWLPTRCFVRLLQNVL